MNPYDQLPYPDRSYAMVHPGHMAVVGTLLGAAPPPVETARVLEVGCASGGNLIPIAARLPRARLLGIDLSERQVKTASARIAALRLENVEVRRADIRCLPADLGEFDYVLAHGVYSWVPADVQAALLQLCRECLAPDGIALVSYNTYPGWTVRGMVRDMMTFHAGRFDSAARQVSQSRRLLDLVASSADGSGLGIALREAAEARRGDEDAYLFHDDLEADNEPLWFREFARRVRTHDLRYLGDLNPASAIENGLPPAVRELVAEAGGDIVLREQYLDFFRNRAFRESLLVRSDVEMPAAIDPRRFETLWLAGDLRAASEEPDLSTEAPEEFRRGEEGGLRVSRPLTKAVLCVLREHWPRALPFGEAIDLAWSRTGLDGAQPPAEERASVAAELFCAFAGRALHVLAHPDTATDRVAERPAAFAPARLAAAGGDDTVTNVRHGRVRVAEFARAVLARLDGTNDVAALVDRLTEEIELGDLDPPEPTGDLTPDDGLPEFLAVEIRGCLDSLLEAALLVDQPQASGLSG